MERGRVFPISKREEKVSTSQSEEKKNSIMSQKISFYKNWDFYK